MTNEAGTFTQPILNTQSILNRASSVASNKAASSIRKALHQAGSKTGVSFEFLLNTAKRESSLNPEAKAKTSSATGLFQFIDQTWLAAIYKHGANHGLGDEASKIQQDKNGHFNVANPKDRDAILNLRLNPEKASALAAELAADNRSYLEKKIGRSVNDAELYAAHFLGAGGAAKLLSAAANTKAADILPAAAKANKGVFYALNGAKTVGDVIASFEASFEKTFAGPASDASSLSTSTSLPAISPSTKQPIFSQPIFSELTQSTANLAISPQSNEPSGIHRSVKLTPEATSAERPSSSRPLTPPPLTSIAEQTPLQNLRSYSLRSYGGLHNLSPLAISVLQSLDPTLLSRRNKS